MNLRIYKTSAYKSHQETIVSSLEAAKWAENLRDGYSDLLMMIAPSPSG